MKRARAILEDYPDLRTAVNDVSAVPGRPRGRKTLASSTSPQGPRSTSWPSIRDRAHAPSSKQIPACSTSTTTLSLRKPEVQVAIDRDAASDLGVPVGTIADTLRVLVGGCRSPSSKRRDRAIRRLAPGRTSRSARCRRLCPDLSFPSPTVGLVQAGQPGQAQRGRRAPAEIERLNRERIVTVAGQSRRHVAQRGGPQGPRHRARR